MFISNTYITDNSSQDIVISKVKLQAALSWCCHVVFWCYDAPPSTDPPIHEVSLVLQYPGCQLFSSYHSCSTDR